MAEPKMRFKKDDGSDYPAWNDSYVGDICKIQTGKSNTQDAVDDGTYPFYVRSPIIYRSNRYLFDKEAVITVGDGVGTGKVYHYVNGKFDLHQRAYAMTDFQNMIGKYFYYYFSSHFYNRIASLTAKTSVDSVRYEAIDKMKIEYPSSLEEQQEIADFLSSVDEVISTSEEEVANLETQKKAVMKKIFSQEVRFKRADGSDFHEWEEKPIREFAQCVAGATPSTKVEDYWKNGTIPWMSSGEVNKGLVFDTDAKITQLGYDNTSTKMVPPETVVMALAGQGKTRGMVALTKIELCTNQSLCSIVSDGSVCSAYLYQYLITQYQNLRQVSSGDGTRGGLNLQLVGDYVVLIPSLEEQRLIADFLSDFDEAIAAAKKELELWKELKKGLLQQMFV